jgi:hypothetical protein
MDLAEVITKDIQDVPSQEQPIKNLFLIKELASSTFSQWFLDKRKVYRCVIKKPHGTYKVASSHIPTHFDTFVLHLLLNKLYLQTKFLSRQLKTTSYEITHSVNRYQPADNEVTFETIMASLTRLHGLKIEFDGIFFEGDNHTIRFFSVLTDIIHFESGELHIGFNQQYLQQVCSNSCNHLSTKKIRSSLFTLPHC